MVALLLFIGDCTFVLHAQVKEHMVSVLRPYY